MKSLYEFPTDHLKNLPQPVESHPPTTQLPALNGVGVCPIPSIQNDEDNDDDDTGSTSTVDTMSDDEGDEIEEQQGHEHEGAEDSGGQSSAEDGNVTEGQSLVNGQFETYSDESFGDENETEQVEPKSLFQRFKNICVFHPLAPAHTIDHDAAPEGATGSNPENDVSYNSSQIRRKEDWDSQSSL